MGDDFCEERGEVLGEGALDAEGGGNDLEERVRKGWGEEPREQRCVIYWKAC